MYSMEYDLRVLRSSDAHVKTRWSLHGYRLEWVANVSCSNREKPGEWEYRGKTARGRRRFKY